jgi:hypothetical protein
VPATVCDLDVLDEIGFAIGDQLLANFDPANVYLTIHRAGSDSGLFISNGSTTVYRYNIAAVVGTRRDLLQRQGNQKYFRGRRRLPATVRQSVRQRVYLVSEHGAVAGRHFFYSAYATIGTLVIAPLGTTTPLGAVLIERVATGSDATVSVLLNEISGTFVALPNPVSDPPLLPASATVIAKRHYLKTAAKPLPEGVRHLQVKISFAAENAKNELLGFALLP